MSQSADRFGELRVLIEMLCEDRLTGEHAARLDELTLTDAPARRFYLEYIELHGNLHWDAAQARSVETHPADAHAVATAKEIRSARAVEAGQRQGSQRRSRWAVVAGVAVVLAAAFATWALQEPAASLPIATRPDGPSPPPAPSDSSNDETRVAAVTPDEAIDVPKRLSAPVVDLTVARNDNPPDKTASATIEPNQHLLPKPDPPEKPAMPMDAAESDDAESASLLDFVNSRIRSSWKHAGIEPSPIADDAEWVRRVYLDILGHTPPEEAVGAFLDDGEQKRPALVERLLEDAAYPRNWTTVWTNLLVGRHPSAAGVNREALEKFLRDRFAANAPWNEIVYELVSAEGSSDQNPAANFLLAHLNNEAVPATAKTARMFLGVQVQCTQCHDHPFHNEKQNRFWELNSFFQQTEKVERVGAAAGGSMTPVVELVTRSVGGPTFYETRRGEMRAAFPVYAGQKADPSPSANRRRELARFIAKGDDRQLALAMVNRLWQHFFGNGFTRPVDDMGPHNPPTHPDVLERLATEFIASNYDLKQLIRWICVTDAYQRASTLEKTNLPDDPTTGAAPLFSRVYLKPMTAEQLYDSLLVATRAKMSARTDWGDIGRRRQDWIRQFVINYGTDENDETTTLAGTVSQALLLMNDPIVEGALAVEPGTLLYDVAHSDAPDAAKIRRLCRSALSRDPADAEARAALDHLNARRREVASSGKERERNEGQALQDVFWAFLNANEFAVVH